MSAVYHTMNNIIYIKDIIIPLLGILLSVSIALYVSKQTLRNQYKKGKYQLFHITNRYFLNVYNSVEQGPKSVRTKRESIDRTHQLTELKSINNDLALFMDNPYYLDVLLKYPEMNMITLRLRREIVKIENENKVSIEADNIDFFYNLHKKIEKDIPKKYLEKAAFKEIKTAVDEIYQGFYPYMTKAKINTQK